MKFLPALLIVGLMSPVGVRQTQEPPQKPKEPTFEGCLAKGTAEDSILLRNAHAVGGTIVGTGLRFRVLPVSESVVLLTHLNHIVQVTGPIEGTVPASGRVVPERELPLIRVRTLKMISTECLQP